MTDPLHEIIFERLATDDTPADVADVVLAALSSEDDLEAALAGRPTSLDLPADETPAAPASGIYLASVIVAGFRGVGPERELTLRPAPGLTVVVGRNGSGKSSFAEAIELSLTGDSVRWADRNSVWRTGWRNIHTGDPCAIRTVLHIDGTTEPMRISRTWAAGAALADASVKVSGALGPDVDLSRPLRLYRPFLTAAEFGKLLMGTPSELFDALNTILGLEALGDADKRLMRAAKPLDDDIKRVKADREALHARLADIDDDRAARAGSVLTARVPNLGELDALLAEPMDAAHPDASIAAAQRLRDLAVPSLDEVIDLTGKLRTGAAEAVSHDDARDRGLVRTAELLRVALDHHAESGDGPCPVCRTGTLDTAWRTAATAQLDDLRDGALAVKRVTDQLATATRRARTLLANLPAPDITATQAIAGQVVANADSANQATADRGIADPDRTGQAVIGPDHADHGIASADNAGRGIADPDDAADPDSAGLGISIERLRIAIECAQMAPSAPAALAEHLDTTYPEVVEAVADVRTRAAEWLDQRERDWRRIADELRAWSALARRTATYSPTIARLKAARAWFKESGVQLRNERFAPFAAQAQVIWEKLRQDSNVELGRMSLAGTNTSRRFDIPVSVDGSDGAALGVMSQGELHALGLAAFLPRSCAVESPFRFIVIDDPVQSMDPAKVDGLVRVLADLAADRQVVVFTHDNRLPDAIRHLDIDAAVVEVHRAERSVITLRRGDSPVRRYLSDADAVAKSREIPDAERGPVIAELCRSALEAACHDVIWRRRLARGDRHADIEAAISATARSVATVFALALFDDASRGGDVLHKLNQRHGPWAADAYQDARQGVHGRFRTDLNRFVQNCSRLAKELS